MRKMTFLAMTLLIATSAHADRRATSWARRTLQSMTLDEKIGQMLIPNIGGGFRNIESDEFLKTAREIEQFHIGGIHVAAGEPPSTALLVNDLQKLSKTPLLVTADLEGGAGFIFPGSTRLPLAMAIGATGSEDLAYQAGKVAAEEGKAIGVHVNFYPVVDVNNNPRNPIINIRSFGEDPARVSTLARAYIRGIQENGMMATAKHFPGHGDVSTDSHLEMPVLDASRKRLDSLELVPFRAAIDQGVGAVMSAHMYVPSVEPERGLPSTLSKNVLTGVLRDQLHFEGLVFTDAMTMRAITSNFANEEAAIRAVEAGADILLYAPDVEKIFGAIKSAVASGRIPLSRIDDAARHVLEAKAKLGLNRWKASDVAALTRLVGSKTHRNLAASIYEQAVTVVRDQKKVLPLRLAPDQSLLHVNLLDSRSGWREGMVGRTTAAEIAKRHPKAVTVQLDDQSTRNEYELTRRLAGASDVVVITAFIRVAPYKGSIDLGREQLAFLRDAAKLDKPMVFVLFGSPYLLGHVPELPSYVLAWDTTPGAELASVRVISGEVPARGRLPVSLPGLHALGEGIVTDGPRE